MNRQEILDLMGKAGFNTEWTGYASLRETLEKYEKFADLVEHQVVAQLASLQGEATSHVDGMQRNFDRIKPGRLSQLF